MAVLFVICVRLPEILYQKALQPKRPGISGVRQLYQLIPIQVPPLVPNVTHPFFLQAQEFISGVDTWPSNKFIFSEYMIKVRVAVVYRLYNRRAENNDGLR